MVVGKDHSISFKTQDPTPGPNPSVVIQQQWPPPVTDWSHEDSWSEDNWHNQELTRYNPEQEDEEEEEDESEKWSFDISKTYEPQGGSILDRWHKEQQQKQQQQNM